MEFLIHSNINQTEIWRSKWENRILISKSDLIEGHFFIIKIQDEFENRSALP